MTHFCLRVPPCLLDSIDHSLSLSIPPFLFLIFLYFFTHTLPSFPPSLSSYTSSIITSLNHTLFLLPFFLHSFIPFFTHAPTSLSLPALTPHTSLPSHRLTNSLIHSPCSCHFLSQLALHNDLCEVVRIGILERHL